MMKKFGLLLCLAFCLSGCRPVGWVEARWSDPLTTHKLVQKDASCLELLWVQTVLTADYSGRQLAATNSKVFFIGSLSANGPRALIALDNESGNELWQVPDVTTIDVGPEMVYVDNGASVMAYTPMGEKLWQIRLRGARNVSGINEVDGNLYVNAGDFHIIDAMTGELLTSYKEYNPELAIYYRKKLAYVDRYIFARGEENIFFGAAFALDRNNGDMLWQSVDNVISNVAATNNLAFVITYEDELHILDTRTGKLLEKIRIEPSINFFSEEVDSANRLYQLAVDQTNQILYVLLGDSNQLFAFRIKSGK